MKRKEREEKKSPLPDEKKRRLNNQPPQDTPPAEDIKTGKVLWEQKQKLLEMKSVDEDLKNSKEEMKDEEEEGNVRKQITGVERARKSCSYGYMDEACTRELYEKVQKGLANNVKMGPFKATSGLILPYYLNLTTNFLDENIAPDIIDLCTGYLENVVKKQIQVRENERILAVGMEVAGGVMASQFACKTGSLLFKWMDFVYMRKERKTAGTLQQLEGPNLFTKRTPESPPLRAIWLDDCMSTGGSMVKGIHLLKRDYNIEVVASFFLVDRSKDRRNLGEDRLRMSSPEFEDFVLGAPFDLEDIDKLIPYKRE